MLANPSAPVHHLDIVFGMIELQGQASLLALDRSIVAGGRNAFAYISQEQAEIADYLAHLEALLAPCLDSFQLFG